MIELLSLQNKHIVVTGASGCLGSAIVKLLTHCGAYVTGVDVHTCKALQEYICQSELHARFVEMDISDDIQTSLFFGELEKEDFYGLVNCAYPRTADWGSKLEMVKLQSLRKNIDMQMTSVFFWCQQAIRLLQTRGGGSIVNIGSMHGVVAPNFHVYEGSDMTSPAGYSLIKGGIIQFTKYLASYCGPMNIRINCVSPGGIRDGQHPTFIDNYKKYCPMERMGEPEEIAGAVVFLLSEAASYITGHNLVVDGGVSIC